MTLLRLWLCTLDTDDLAAVLRHRPDVLRGVEPRGPAELASRPEDAYSVAGALHTAPAPVLELLQALLALGIAHRESVSRLLDDSTADDGTLAYAAALHQLMPTPRGLGTPAYRLLDPINADTLNKYAAAACHSVR